MTRRQNAAAHYHQLHERLAAGNVHRDGAQVVAALRQLPAYAPTLWSNKNTRCYACDDLIEPGHTAFTCQGHHSPAPVLCFRCGVGWCIFSGSHPLEFFDDLPAIGGPRS